MANDFRERQLMVQNNYIHDIYIHRKTAFKNELFRSVSLPEIPTLSIFLCGESTFVHGQKHGQNLYFHGEIPT